MNDTNVVVPCSDDEFLDWLDKNRKLTHKHFPIDCWLLLDTLLGIALKQREELSELKLILGDDLK